MDNLLLAAQAVAKHYRCRATNLRIIGDEIMVSNLVEPATRMIITGVVYYNRRAWRTKPSLYRRYRSLRQAARLTDAPDISSLRFRDPNGIQHILNVDQAADEAWFNLCPRRKGVDFGAPQDLTDEFGPELIDCDRVTTRVAQIFGFDFVPTEAHRMIGHYGHCPTCSQDKATVDKLETYVGYQLRIQTDPEGRQELYRLRNALRGIDKGFYHWYP